MSQAHLHAYDPSTGAWAPLRVSESGQLQAGAASQGWTYSAASSGITDTADVTLAAAGGAGVANFLRSLQVVNAHATTSTEVVVKDGSTVIWRGYAKVSVPLVVNFDPPLASSANTALNFACITTSTSTYVSAQGWRGVTIAYIGGAYTVVEEILDQAGNLITDAAGATIYLQ